MKFLKMFGHIPSCVLESMYSTEVYSWQICADLCNLRDCVKLGEWRFALDTRL